MITTILAMLIAGALILLGFGFALTKLTRYHENEKQIYRDAYRERWTREKGSSL